MKLKSGKQEIAYLLNKVIQKFEAENQLHIIRNSNRKNYEGVARKLSEISNQLPYTADLLQHDSYLPETSHRTLEYPFRKYDITGNQIKDAFYNQIVTHPRSFLIDASYIYVYGIGRKGFEINPIDTALLDNAPAHHISDSVILQQEHHNSLKWKKQRSLLLISLVIVSTLAVVGIYQWMHIKNEWEAIKSDMKILPYQPTQAEIDSLEGIWLCYTGSPQARSFDPNRYHMVISNIAEIKYKNGYFTLIRYGSNFNHTGYIQYESSGLVSIHSQVKNSTNAVESPKHSLMKLDKNKSFLSVISASWNFDIGEHNDIIGIREIFIKLGKQGYIEEIINKPENALCRCKIIKWHQNKDNIQSYHLKNELLDTLKYEALKTLIDEKSLLLREPVNGLILSSQKKK